MFDYVLQLSGSMMARIFDAMRRAALPVLPPTITMDTPIDLGGVTVVPVINIPDAAFPLTLDSDDQVIQIAVPDVPVQLLALDGATDGDVLYETAASFLIRLPVASLTTDDRVRVGSDPADLTAGTVLANIDAGHPLSDDAVLLDILDRELQALLTAGGFAETGTITDAPLAGTPFTLAAFYRLNESLTVTDDLSARVEPSAQPGSFFRFVMPFEFYANVDLDGTTLRHTELLGEVALEVPVLRDLNPGGDAPAEVEIRLVGATVEIEMLQILGGVDITQDPPVWDAIRDVMRTEIQALLADFGDQTITMLSLDQMTALLRDLVRDAIAVDRDDDGAPDFIEFWSADRTEEIDTVEAAIIGDTLTIAINGGEGADIAAIEPFIPFDRDFAVRVTGDPLLSEISSLLVATAPYDEAEGPIKLATDTAAGATEIFLRGFAAESGTFRRRTRLRIDGFVHTVTDDAEISRLDDDDPSPAEGRDRNLAQVSIAPGLRSALDAGRSVGVEFGVGLPITESIDFPGWSFRVNDDITPTLEDGHIRLAGRGRLNRAAFPDIGADIAMRIALDWVSSARVRGGGQSGDDLAVATRSETLREYRAGSLIVVDDHRAPYGLTATTPAGDAVLSLDRPLDDSPDDRGMLSLRWPQIGRVSAGPQAGNALTITDMTEGAGVVPAGAVVRIGGARFLVDADATIADDGRVTMSLGERLDSVIADGPDDDAEVRFEGGWTGRGVVDGADQTGGALNVAAVVRIVPRGRVLSIAGLNGTFEVRAEADIVDDTATVELRHQALSELADRIPGIDESDMLWELFGQPAANATVRRRAGGQMTELRRVGDVEVSLDNPLLEGIAAILGALGALLVPGGLVFRVLVGAVIGIIARNLFRNTLQAEANDFELDNIVDLPIDDQLSGFGVFVEPILNNPIDISPAGLLFAGTANPATAYPEVAGSRARTDGPFVFTAGISGQLSGSGPAPATLYGWQSGDGTALGGTAPAHTYPRHGVYVADYGALDTQLIAQRRTRELARVEVRNSPPVLGPLPALSGLEGDEIVLTATFTDAAWTDSHRALVVWGDDTLPDFAEITETLGPPRTTGTLTARHRYCDDGDFVVTVILEDAQGGSERRQTTARILNVPPRVEAGPDMFAHPCVPLRLVGRFTDPGWCDTHTAIWNFGDCSEPFPATVEETHTPPEGRGTATATHCYTGCGTWQARLTVIDDDGGVGTDTLVVTTSRLENGGFEAGFDRTPLGRVGRHWMPYGVLAGSVPPPGPVFDCETCLVFAGDSAQSVTAPAHRAAGLRQSFGANPGWEYQVAARLIVGGREASGWIGIDPAGGTDRNAAEIVWRSVGAADGWQGVSTRAVAVADAVTVFVEFRGSVVETHVVDSVEMQAYPCIPDAPGPPEDEPFDEIELCIDWPTLDAAGVLGPAFDIAGFAFRTATGGALSTVTFGAPEGARKLRIPDRPDALIVTTPGGGHTATATVWGPPGSAITLLARGAGGATLDEASDAGDGLRTLSVAGDGIAGIELRSDFRGTLIRLCIQAGQARANDRTTGERPT